MVREYIAGDWPEWLRMRQSLWPESDLQDVMDWLSRSDAVTLVAEQAGGSGLCGFAEIGERDYADGCDSSPVAFLEGWYVDPDARNSGVGRELIEAAEAWASARGLKEFASDSLLENHDAHLAHLKVGFEETERCIKYRKVLSGGSIGRK